jgi:antitoxin VapB
MKRRTVTAAAIRAMVIENTKASARLEGRQVPEGHVRSPAVERYIAERTSQNTDAPTSRRAPGADTNTETDDFRAGDHGSELLHVLATEIWPLLAERSPITKAEREQMLGDPTGM